MSSKHCPRCGRTLSLTEFHKNHSTRDGLSCWCRDCANENTRKFAKTPSGIYTNIKSRVRYRSKNPRRWGMDKPFNITREEFTEWYESQPKSCVYCGIWEEDLVLISDSYNNRTPRLTVDCRNNERGYEVNNLVLACHRCNTTKNDFFTYEDMLIIGSLIKTKWEGIKETTNTPKGDKKSRQPIMAQRTADSPGRDVCGLRKRVKSDD